MNIFGKVKFCIKGVNQERNFTALSKVCKVTNIKKSEGTLAEFYVSVFDEKVASKTIKKLGLTTLSKEKTGLLKPIFTLIKRTGILIAIFFAFFANAILSNFVFNSSFVGIENIKKEQIEQVLKQNNLYGFVFKGKLDTTQVENLILDSFDNVSLVSAIVKGNTLIISIKEKLINDEYEDIDNFKPLKSNCYGLVTEIKLLQGTLKVKVGDVIKAGDVLVEPYILDSSGQQRKVKAQAEITAKVWYIGKENHFSSKLEVQRTGKKQRVVNLTFLGINLTNPTNLKAPYESYELVQTDVCISKSNILPIYRQEYIFYETQSVTVNQSFEEVKDVVLQKAKQKALLLVEEYDIISKEYFNIASSSNVTFVEYVIEVQKNITKGE